ncbi:MAG: PTS sugar transporter subunit IIB, partial [Pantoea sp.]|nr:PTS sugar transporter subunit IIB [Pantoea sp.]
MKRIVLACAAGMSTSMVVTRMEKEAAARGLSYQIYAIPEQNLREELENHAGEVAVVLLGPQVRFKLEENRKLTEHHRVPLAVIDTLA